MFLENSPTLDIKFKQYSSYYKLKLKISSNQENWPLKKILHHFIKNFHPELHPARILCAALHVRLQADVQVVGRVVRHSLPGSRKWFSGFHKVAPSCQEEVTEEQVVVIECQVVDMVLEQVVEVICMTNTKIAVIESENKICVRIGKEWKRS